MLMDRLKRMSEKLKARSKNKLSSILSQSTGVSHSKTTSDPRLSRNGMPPSRRPQSPTSPTTPATCFRPQLSTPIRSTGDNRPRTLSTPASVPTPPSVQVRIPRPSSPNGAPAQFRRPVGHFTREQRHANEKRAATEESEKCRAELIREGIKVRDFQAEHDAEKERRKLLSTAGCRKGGQQRRGSDSEAVSEEDEVVMRGRRSEGSRS